MKKNLKILLTITCSVLLLLVISFIAFDIHRKNQNEVISNFKDYQLLVAQQYSKNIYDFFYASTQSLNMLSSLPSIQYHIPDKMKEDLNDYLRHFEKLYIKDILIADENGSVLYSSSQDFRDKYPSDRELWNWVRKVENKEKVFVFCKSDPSYRMSPKKQSKTSQAFLVKPFYREEDTYRSGKKFSGAIILAIDISQFLEEHILKRPAKKKYGLWIIDYDGTVIFQSNHPEMQGNNINRTKTECYHCHLSFDYVNRIIQEKKGAIDYQLSDRPKKLAAFYPMDFENAHWVVGVNRPYKAITAYINKSFQKTLLLVALVILIFSFSSLIIYRNYKDIHAVKERAKYWKEKALLEHEVRRMKNHLETLLNNSPDLIYSIKRDGTFSYINPQLEKLTGYSLDQVQGKKFIEFVPEHQKSFILEKWKEINRSGNSKVYETEIIKADGSIMPCLISHSYLKDYDEFLLSIKDISEQKRLQKKIAAIYEFSRKMINLLDEPQIIQATLKAARKLLNFEFCDFLLVDEEKRELVVVDSLGESPNLLGQRISIYGNKGITAAVARSGQAVNLFDVSKDNRYLPFRFKEGSELCVPVKIKEKVIGVINAEKNMVNGFSVDDLLLLSELSSQAAIAIENARLNKSILESEQKYRSVIENIGIGISLLSPKMEILSLNNQMKKWFPDIEVSKRPICYRSFKNPPEDDICSYCPAYKTFKDGKIHEAMIEIPTNGHGKSYRIITSPIRNKDDEVISVIKMIEDITERKKAELALKESEGKLNAMLQSIGDHMTMLDKNLNILWANETAKKAYGHDIIGKKCYEVLHKRKEPCEPYPCHVLETFQDGKVHDHEVELPNEDGESKYFHCTSNVALRDERGHPTAVLRIARDISKSKLAEEALRQRTRDLSDRVKELNCLYEASKLMSDSRKSLNDVLQGIANLIPPSFRYPNTTCARVAFEGREYKRNHFQETKWKQSVAIRVFNKKVGSIDVYYLKDNPAIHDGRFPKEERDLIETLAIQIGKFAERKRTEESLWKSEEKYRNLFEESRDAAYIITREGKFVDFNQAALELFGYSNEELKVRNIMDIYALSSDWKKFQHEIEKKGFVRDFELQLRKKDGTVMTCLDTATVRLAHDGSILGYQGFMRDITERKQLEETIIEAKEEWEKTFDSVQDLIAIIDRNHRIKRLNKAMADHIGMDIKDIIGLRCYELIHGTKKPPLFCPHAKLLADGKEHKTEIHEECFEGDFLVTMTPLYGDQREIIGSVHVAHDITERKRNEEAIKESEEKYRSVVEGSLTGIFIFQGGVFKFVNNRFCEIFGYKQNEVIDKIGLFDIIHPNDRTTVQKNLEDYSKEPRHSSENELKALKKNGEIFPVRILGNTMKYKGKPAIMGSILDLSKEKVLELQLMRSQKMESLGLLAGGIAHDFNNILGIISGSLDIIKNNELHEKSKKMVKMAINAAERGSEIVKRLLIFARAEEAELVPISISEIIEETVKILEHTLEKNITIRKSIEDFSLIVLGNKEQMIQMLLNLCVNARDAMPAGGTLKICLQKADKAKMLERLPKIKEKDYCVLHVTDTGRGMDDWVKEHIFDPFFTTKEKGKGTGLGLSIVHGIVKGHKGLIDVKSSRGHGTTFSIYLPLASASVKKEARSESKEQLVGGNEKILIVEDEEYLREILKESLVSLGYEVLEAEDAFEAIEIFKEKSQMIRLTILDIGLPRMSGDQVFLKLKEIDPKLNVLITSGYIEPTRKKELKELGVKEVIHKPYSLAKIAAIIRKILDETKKETVETPQIA